MYKNACSCKKRGRLYIYIESKNKKEVEVQIKEENQYCDKYRVQMKEGMGKFMVEGISEGFLYIETNLQNPTFTPSNLLLFDEEHTILKVHIMDGEEKDVL